MPHPILAFCPYLETSDIFEFADWHLGPLEAFEHRWADEAFHTQAKAFLSKFVDDSGDQIKSPTLLCRKSGSIDGLAPTSEEIEALTAAIGFAFLDENPRLTPGRRHHGWQMLTTDNTELFFWPIDVEAGYVTVTTGLMVRTLGGGYQIEDKELVITPPLDLHMTGGSNTADRLCLEAVYSTVFQSAKAPGGDVTADRIKTAIGWFLKAWRNTATVHFPERVVFVKTAFEALTGSSKSYMSAALLRTWFEAIPNTEPTDSQYLIWSPTEKPIHNYTYTKGNRQITDQITDLQQWFMAFATARNDIIHQGGAPPLNYKGTNAAYDGHLVFTAEFLARAVIKVLLSNRGYADLWRSATWRAIKAAWDELEAKQAGTQEGNAEAPTI